jgi:hypothetical protein
MPLPALKILRPAHSVVGQPVEHAADPRVMRAPGLPNLFRPLAREKRPLDRRRVENVSHGQISALAGRRRIERRPIAAERQEFFDGGLARVNRSVCATLEHQGQAEQMNVITQSAVEFGMLERMSIDRKQMRLRVVFFGACAFSKLSHQAQASIGAAPNRGAAVGARAALLGWR